MTTKRALSYTNRRGNVYYLHAGMTKTGKRRFFVARSIGDGALAELPDGFEIAESINGVVSVRRIDRNRPAVPQADLLRVREELAKHPHLRLHRAEVSKGEIVVYGPGLVPAPGARARLHEARAAPRRDRSPRHYDRAGDALLTDHALRAGRRCL
jgi:hypothetical protein